MTLIIHADAEHGQQMGVFLLFACHTAPYLLHHNLTGHCMVIADQAYEVDS